MNDPLFEAWLKGSLGDAEARRLEQRLRDPETARAFVRFVQEWAATADVALQQSARAARPVRRFPRRRRPWLPAAAAAALLLAVLVSLRSSDRAPARRPAPAPPVAARPEPAVEPLPLPEPLRPPPAPPPPLPPPPARAAAPTAPPAAPPPSPPPAPPAPPPTRVEPAFAVLEDGRTLAEGAAFAAAARSVIRLFDGTRLELEPGAALDSLARTPSGPRLELARGTLRATASRPLTVATPHAVAAVLGTDFLLAVSADGTRLTVRSGAVRFSRKGEPGSAPTLGEGQSSFVPRLPRGPLAIETAFQDGVAPGPGYAGGADAELSELEPSAARGSKARVEVDGDERDGKALVGRLRWELAGIPADARVQEAWITLHVAEPSASGAYFVHAARRAWTEAEASWRTAGEPPSGPVLAELHPREPGELAAMLNEAGLAKLQDWIRRPATNHGVLVANASNRNGFSFESREAKAPGRRPKLSVVFTLPAGR